MRNLFARIFADKGIMKTFEHVMKEQHKEELLAGLNVLRARVVIKNTRRFNSFCAKFDLSGEQAKKLMLGTIEHFRKQINGGENNGQNEKQNRA